MPLVIAALCSVLAAGVYVAAVHVPAVQAADLHTLEGFIGLWRLPGAGHVHWLVDLFDPLPFAVLVIGVLAAATLMRRPRIGLLAAGAMIAANVTSQVLKVLLATQRDFPPGHYLGPEAWPSGHSTAVMSFALALVLIAPPHRRRLAAALGGVLTVTTVYGILIMGWHYPSDVVGGLLVATAWASLAAVPLRAREPVSPSAPVLAGCVLVVAASLAVISRPFAAAAYAEANTTFVFGALAIAVAALVLSGSVLAPTGARPRPPARSPRARG
jgi:membrane-associated phospholipid phosphatase